MQAMKSAMPELVDDRLIVHETAVERRVAELAAPVLDTLGFDLVRVKVSGRDGCTVQIMAERPDGTMSIEDCTEASRTLAPVLDHEDPVQGEYHLEMSSPGIDRPLVRQRDFERAIGHETKIELDAKTDGRRRFRGPIEAVDSEGVRLRVEAEDGAPETRTFAFGAIEDARLVMTDRLIEQTLRGARDGPGGAKRPMP